MAFGGNDGGAGLTAREKPAEIRANQPEKDGGKARGKDGDGPPKRYHLITPTDWFRIPLRSETKRNRAIQILVDMAYPNRDEFTVKRHELRELLTDVTQSAAQRDAIEIYLATQAELGIPIPASLMVTAEPENPAMPQQLPTSLLADGIRDRYQDAAEVTVVTLPSGEAVRSRREELSEDSRELGQSKERPNTLLEFYLPVPRSTAWLVLTFSAPLKELADAQVQMFDAIAASFRWSE
ncbi:hypothetical protein [Streptomyces triticirhizae]|uniref:Uncharacterized protein n=1 Tax=Streptomyces triticirhizae TaxID=2483353 RepID=A0A3M2LV26_9ACTN|nr:hypothetical protein [Streptomyces triticirhizae]RMI41344.1 hypothetical protein EBN88_11125 [Streptomyces triticirhizae]